MDFFLQDKSVTEFIKYAFENGYKFGVADTKQGIHIDAHQAANCFLQNLEGEVKYKDIVCTKLNQ
jgi:hypothetical protein